MYSSLQMQLFLYLNNVYIDVLIAGHLWSDPVGCSQSANDGFWMSFSNRTAVLWAPSAIHAGWYSLYGKAPWICVPNTIFARCREKCYHLSHYEIEVIVVRIVMIMFILYLVLYCYQYHDHVHVCTYIPSTQNTFYVWCYTCKNWNYSFVCPHAFVGNHTPMFFLRLFFKLPCQPSKRMRQT